MNNNQRLPSSLPGLLLVVAMLFGLANSHGRLIEPPSRSTMWRYGFNTPPNYNDHELYCGGFSRQWRTNGGKCGICGDPWDSPQPRANEAGGMYGKGVIARKYEREQVIKVRIELTANHMGFFEFRLCPNNNRRKPASQTCLDKHLLREAESGDSRYYPGPGTKVFEMHYQLPKNLTCRQCVFQWRYVAGNNWGKCKNGTGAVGCGPQEEFRACADVTVTESDGSADDTPNNLSDGDNFPDTSDNEIDYGDDSWLQEKDELLERVEFESIIVVALASLLTTAVFFGALFFYYLKGKGYLERYDWSTAKPRIPRMPKAHIPKMPKMSSIHWPLSSVQLKHLPKFLGGSKSDKSVRAGEGAGAAVSSRGKPSTPATTVVSAPITVVSTTNEQATGPPATVLSPQHAHLLPLAPPRTKKHAPPQPPRSSKLATIASRPHPSAASNNVSRPSAPPPVVPPQPSSHDGGDNDDSPAEIDISQPTSVTINGVSVAQTSTVPASSSLSQSDENNGWVMMSARMAVVDAEMPDSMENDSGGVEKEGATPPPEFGNPTQVKSQED